MIDAILNNKINKLHANVRSIAKSIKNKWLMC